MSSGKRPVTQTELAQDLQRFAGGFMHSIAEGAQPLARAEDPRIREIVIRQVLTYESSTLELATGPEPEIDLLDMIVFVSLSRRLLERHWIPNVFGESGKPLLAAFGTAEDAVWNISAKVLDEADRARLRGLIDDWLRDNPDRVAVEAVRFLEFSIMAGKLSTERADETKGLFGNVKSAIKSADQALLLGERAMFLAQRMPFLLRVQVRLGVSEMTSDTLVHLQELERRLREAPNLHPLVHELVELADTSRGTAAETRAALEALAPLVARSSPPGEREKTLASVSQVMESTHETVTAAERLTERTQAILAELHTLLPKGEVATVLSTIEARVDRLARRWIVYLVLLGAAWSLLFWGGYFVFKQLGSR
jgi:hypothetical protein